jgi:putative effector of murein hydrolase
MELFKYGAFANEVAGAISLVPYLTWLYPHHTNTLKQEVMKVLIDLVALTSIAMLTVEEYKKMKNEKDALAAAMGILIVAFALPNLFLHRIIDRFFKTSSTEIRVLAAFCIIFILFRIEPLIVKGIKKMLKSKKED